MSSMDFIPPDTDATAVRLRRELREASLREYGEHDLWCSATKGVYCELTKVTDAALDTLIQYHRSAGAVEALEAVLSLDEPEAHFSREAVWANAYIKAKDALAAAQARLAAYEEER